MMSAEQTEKLNEELKELSEKVKGDFINPKDMRRIDEIRSLLLTNGESGNIKIKIVKGRGGRKGLNTKGYYRKGRVG